MRRLRALVLRMAAVFGAGRTDAEIREELEAHRIFLAAEFQRSGLTPEAARYRAAVEMGSVSSIVNAYQDRRGLPLVETAVRHAHVAARQLLKSPAFTLIAVVGLAFGIGANVTLFSVVNAVLLRPLPYHEPERLVRLASTDPANNLTRVGFSYSRFLDVQQRQHVFSDLALSIDNRFTLTGRGDPEQITGMHAAAALLPALGLQPIIGRNFSPEEDRPGGPRVVLISQQMWFERFNSDPSVLGQSLTLDGALYTIIGVLPEAATAPPFDHLRIWISRPMDVNIAQSQLEGGSYFFRPIARLKPGVSLEQAREAMKAIAAGYRAAHGGNVDASSMIDLVPLLDDTVGAQRQSYLLLFGAVACVLLIACANVANLLLARFMGRRREIAARFALGASRGEVVCQLVSESMLLAVLGGASGLLLAQSALRALVVLGADLIPRAAEISIDPVALGFALVATLVTGLVTGLLPALQVSGVNVLDALKEGGPGSVGSGRHLRAGLLVIEISLSLVLLIAAGLLLTSFMRLQRVDPGFDAGGMFTGQIALPRHYSGDDVMKFYEQFYQRLATLPGASSAALSNIVPLTGNQPPTVVAVAGRPIPPLSERPLANRHLVSPHYFSTLRIPLRAGRDFDERDNTRVPEVVIINETFARRLLPGEDPIGRTLVTGMAQRPARVIGVVADIRGQSLNTLPEPEYFLSALQRPETLTNVLVRSNLPPAAVATLVREQLRTIDPDLPLVQPGALTTRIAQTMANRKLGLMLLAAFAALALVLASLGVYSVTAHLVAFRTSEIGLRMALGASPAVVMRMVLGHSRRHTLVGIAFGIAGALVVSRLMQQALFEVDPAEPVVYITLSVTLLLVAECASFFPARRATRIDPMIALRAE